MSVTLTQSYVGNSNLVVGSKISITLNLEIKGNDTLYDIVIKSPLTHQLNYVPNTIKIDGVLVPSGVDNTLIPITDELTGPKTYVVTFDALIVDDTPNTIIFSSAVEYMPLSDMKLQTVTSNESVILIMYTQLYVVGDVEYDGFNEGVLASQVLILETEPTLTLRMTDFNYKVPEQYYVEFIITNISQLTLTNLLLGVNLPSNVEIVDNSLYINDIHSSLTVITSPISIDPMQPGEQVMVKFLVTAVNGTVSTGKISGELAYKYYVNGVLYSGTQNSLEETVYIYDFDLTITQAIDDDYLEIFDTGKFTIGVKNTGNDTISNIIIRDIVSDRITVDIGSIELNKATLPNPNLLDGISIGSLTKGKISTITFNALVDGGDVHPITVPNIVYGTYDVYSGDSIHYMSGREDANPLSFTIYSMNVRGNVFRLPDNLSKVRLLETVPYGVAIKNMGNVTLEDMIVRSAFSNNLDFVPGSVYVNNVQVFGSIIDGVTVPTLNLQETVTITYSGKVTGYYDTSVTPNAARITNTVSAALKGDVLGKVLTETATFTPVISTVETVNIEITEFTGEPAIIGDNEVLTYTVEFTNTGVTDGTNVKFKTNDNVMFTFVEGSVVEVTTSGDVPVNFGDPKDGWTIPLIKAGESVKYKYEVRIV